MIKSSAAAKKTTLEGDDGFPTRVIMALATEMGDMRRTCDQACVMIVALAAAYGIDVSSMMEL